MILELLSKRHEEWIRMAKSFGADNDASKDLVQDMYLRMHKYVKDPEKIMYNEKEVNTYFVFVVLRNLFISSQKSLSFSQLKAIEDAYELPNYEMEEAHNNLINELWDEVETWHWYDAKLFRLYHTTDMTIKNISEATKISERSIWNTLDNGRKKIQESKKQAYKKYKDSKK